MQPSDQSSISKASLCFLDLPQELQRDIFNFCSQADLICLSLVSKYFRNLAASILYRNFHCLIPGNDETAFNVRSDTLAKGLDTFVTSDYDYAKHLRDISLDTLSAGDKAEITNKPYLFNVSCGKFMNTLLLLTLRKAKSLETFRWNVRVELSRPVYQILHQIDTMRHFHIRLQAGPSQYRAPLPLPLPLLIPLHDHHNDHHHPDFIVAHGDLVAQLPPLLPLNATQVAFNNVPTLPGQVDPTTAGSIAMLYTSSPSYTIPQAPSHLPPAHQAPSKSKIPKKTSSVGEPPTLSGFKKLQSLSVLDIDSLDVVPEIQSCIRDSAETLKRLELSFSDSLGSQARRPPPEVDPDDSDLEVDIDMSPLEHDYHSDLSGPAKVFRAQEEKKNQEAVLGRIFDIEPQVRKRSQKKSRAKDKEKDTSAEQTTDPSRDFINALKAVSTKLMKDLNGLGSLPTSKQEILDIIEAAARKYVARDHDSGDRRNNEGGTNGQSSSGGKLTKGKAAMADLEADSGAESPAGGLFSQSQGNKPRKSTTEASPDDIDIIEPEEQLQLDNVEDPSLDASVGDDTPATSEEAGIANSDGELAAREACQQDRVYGEENQPRTEVSDTEPTTEPVRHIPKHVLRMIRWIREARGLALDSLSIYLIPVKASILSRAIDLRVLKQVTLLNVGNQEPFWNHMLKANKEMELSLRKIFTDNVSRGFLAFIKELDELHECFIMERPAGYKPESFAPKTTVTINEIRRCILKRHLGTLKRLMIKNCDHSWDLDEKTILHICRRGKNLKELACSMSMKTMQIPGLCQLRALHVVHLRNDDTCPWVLREAKRFLVDNLAHHPDMELEWLSVDEINTVTRLTRPSSCPDQEKTRKKADKKGKQTVKTVPLFGTDMFPVIPSAEYSGSDSDEDVQVRKIAMSDRYYFCDVPDVRIFNKYVVLGCL